MPTGLGCTYFPQRPCFKCKDKVLYMIPGYEQSLWLWNLNLYETQSTEAHTLQAQKTSKETKQIYIYVCVLNSIINTQHSPLQKYMSHCVCCSCPKSIALWTWLSGGCSAIWFGCTLAHFIHHAWVLQLGDKNRKVGNRNKNRSIRNTMSAPAHASGIKVIKRTHSFCFW